MSGSLVGGVIGAAIGSLVGMPNVGWMVGSMTGGYMDQPDRQGPRLSDLHPQTSEYGRSIPLVYGTMGIQGNVIWAMDLIEAQHTSGGKGGGPTSTTYTYSANFAVMFAEGTKQIGRIFAGAEKTLLWDGQKLYQGGTIRIYTGSEDQLPDPLIESVKGVGKTPAYRGSVYVVFEGLQLASFGNALPFLTAEVGDFAPGSVITAGSGGTGTDTSLPLIFDPLQQAYGATTTTTTPPPTGTTAPFRMGVNVHTGGSGTSENTAITQLLGNRKLNNPRMDLVYDQGPWTNERDFITKVNATGGKVQVALLTSYQWDHTVYTNLAAVEANAYNQAYATVNAMKDIVHDFELLNEISLRSECLAAVPQNTGQTITPYQGKPAYESIAAVCKGMADAVHDVAAASGLPLRVILGAVGRDFGMLSYMASRGVNWDVTGYHIYPHYGDASLLSDPWFGTGGPLVQLAAFGKPVTINEFNAGEIYDSGYENVEGQPVTEAGFSSNAKHMKELYSQTLCTLESVVFYELLDEPAKAPPENRFGVMFDLNNPKTSLFVATAFAGGTLSTAERGQLTSRGLLTDAEITAMQGSAPTTTTTTTTASNPTGFYPTVYISATGMLWEANQQAGDATGAPNWPTMPAGSISLVNPASMTVVGTTHNDPIRSWRELVYDPVSQTVYAREPYRAYVASFDALTGEFIAEYQFPVFPGTTQNPKATAMAVDPTNGHLWVATESGDVYLWTSRTLGTPAVSVSVSSHQWFVDANGVPTSFISSLAVASDGSGYGVDGAIGYGWKFDAGTLTPTIMNNMFQSEKVVYNASTNVVYWAVNNSGTGNNVVLAYDVASQTVVMTGQAVYAIQATTVDLKYDTTNNLLWELFGNVVRYRNPADLTILNAVVIDPTDTSMTVGLAASTSPCAYLSMADGRIQKACFAPAGAATTGYIPTPLNTTLAAVVTDLSARAGLPASKLDVTALTDPIDGFIIAQQRDIRGCIDALRPVFYFDAIESMGLIKYVKRGGSVAVVIPEDHLGAKQEGATLVDKLNATRKMENELPRFVTVGYMLRATNYDHSTKQSRRQIGASGAETTLDVPMTLTDAKAMEVSAANLMTLWVGRISFSFTLPPSYLQYEPTDIVSIGPYVMRLTKMVAENGLLSCEAQNEEIDSYTPHVIVSETDPVQVVVPQTSMTVLEVM